jgi:uncharacterized protein DUF4349
MEEAMVNRWVLALPLVAASLACSSMGELAPARGLADARSGQKREASDGRLLIRTASMDLEVDDAEKSSAAVTRIVSEVEGVVDSSVARKEGSVDFVVRVPEAQLESVMKRFEELGDVKRRSVSTTDVTEEVVDVDARLKNLVSTRDSLRVLFEKATSVQDVVTVERELSRVQGDIDALEARLKSLRSRVALSEIDLTLTRAKILGPIGVIGKGVWWLVSKLFVFRE